MLAAAPPRAGWFSETDPPDIERLVELTAQSTPLSRYHYASTIEREVVFYDMTSLTPVVATPTGRRDVMAELAEVLRDGSGVFVIRHAVARDALDRTTRAFEAMIAAQAAAGGSAGDHFAMAGANDRVWNAFQKLAFDAPDAFVDYYESDAIALAAMAWLGPGYQVTSQLNRVRPGGAAQRAHRDFPLGFMSAAQASAYPAHVHTIAPQLTLQGAVAHVDMPVESGPTMYLPHSQKLADGYIAWHSPSVTTLFEEQFVQLPLNAGDAVFFNPAVFHAAGSNRTFDVLRLANLLQIVSPFVRAMETIDRARIIDAIYGRLIERRASGWSDDALDRVIAAACDDYPFPTNLDRDPPTDGHAPPSQADVVRRAIFEHWPLDRLDDELSLSAQRRRSG